MFNRRFVETGEKIARLSSIVQKMKADLAQSQEDQLVKENKNLQANVLTLKKKLAMLEEKNGVEQIKVPNQKTLPKEKNSQASTTQIAANASQNEPTPKKESKPKQQKQGKAAKPAAAKAKNNKAAAEPAKVDVSRLDLRVGFIKTIKLHPDADSLYLEQIDVGEETPRTVVTGVVKYVPIEKMQNRKVVVLCNLKPAKMRGILSQAMVMCASSPDQVEVLDPPASAVPGDRVYVPGFEGTPDAQLNPKKKVFEKIQPDFLMNDEGVACYRGVPWVIEGKGNCRSQTMKGTGIK